MSVEGVNSATAIIIGAYPVIPMIFVTVFTASWKVPGIALSDYRG
jgi:hypothetical protein